MPDSEKIAKLKKYVKNFKEVSIPLYDKIIKGEEVSKEQMNVHDTISGFFEIANVQCEGKKLPSKKIIDKTLEKYAKTNDIEVPSEIDEQKKFFEECIKNVYPDYLSNDQYKLN